MKTLKIEIPEGFEIELFNKSTGEIKFKAISKNVMDRAKTFQDVLDELGINHDDFEEETRHFTSDEKAYRQVKMIVKALNEGWQPNWKNSNETKYFPWFDMDGSAGSGFSCGGCDGWGSASDVGSRLCFKSRELAEYAGKQFEDIYKEFLTK